jgi:drug/metabolite transporter superfamily protein YnfA
MKIGFFEKWNPEAGQKEFSITRVQMVLMTLFAMFFTYQYFVTEGNPISVNAIFLVLVLLLSAYVPKALKDLTDIRGRFK